MNRRTFIGLCATVPIAGCAASSEVDGEVVVSETVFGQTQVFNFDAEAGDVINVHVENESGFLALVAVHGPDQNVLLDYEEVETEDEFSVTAEDTGVHRVELAPDERASVQVALE